MQKKKAKKKNKSTSKKLIAFLFLNCTLVELFVGVVTILSIKLAIETGITPDYTPLVTLVGAVISEVIGYAVYSLKSAKENTKGGIKYDIAMKEYDESSVEG